MNLKKMVSRNGPWYKTKFLFVIRNVEGLFSKLSGKAHDDRTKCRHDKLADVGEGESLNLLALDQLTNRPVRTVPPFVQYCAPLKSVFFLIFFDEVYSVYFFLSWNTKRKTLSEFLLQFLVTIFRC